ncbi:MAG: hypothetical protein LIO79_09225 [Rikenellaceae bacterium]|nr:hypothetical protein [Rikenellaceae bacterium]
MTVYRKFIKCGLIISISLPILFSCRDFSFTSYVRGESIASVGDSELYYEDFKSIFVPGLTAEDSVKLMRAYVDNWVKNQIKARFAEEHYDGGLADIEKMVEDYRNSLLIFKYENEYVHNRLDTSVTRAEIDDYYIKNRTDFILPNPLLKAVAVRIPNGFRQESAIRELARSSRADNLQDIVDIAIKNDLDYIQHREWTDYGEIISFLPRLSQQQYHEIQNKTGFYEFSEGGYRFMLAVNDILPEGGIMPVNMASASIRNIILNRRSADLLKHFEDSLYNSAMKRGDIYIKRDPVADSVYNLE